MISSNHSNSVRKPNFKTYKQRNRFYRIISAIYVIAQEEIIVFWQVSSNFEQLLQIIKLTMNITTNSYRSSDLMNIFLLLKNLFGTLTKLTDAIFRQHLTFMQPLDLFIKVIRIGEFIKIWFLFISHNLEFD